MCAECIIGIHGSQLQVSEVQQAQLECGIYKSKHDNIDIGSNLCKCIAARLEVSSITQLFKKLLNRDTEEENMSIPKMARANEGISC